jgi:hypothetical protein
MLILHKCVRRGKKTMRAITGIIFGFVWLIVVMLVGMLIISNIVAHANDSGGLVDDAATTWANMVSYMWISLGIIAFAPLLMVLAVFSGILGGSGFGN